MIAMRRAGTGLLASILVAGLGITITEPAAAAPAGAPLYATGAADEVPSRYIVVLKDRKSVV